MYLIFLGNNLWQEAVMHSVSNEIMALLAIIKFCSFGLSFTLFFMPFCGLQN